MTIPWDLSWSGVVSVASTATRLSAMLLLTPVLGFATLPGTIRITFILTLAIVISMGSGITAAPIASEDAGSIALLFANEVIIGLSLGLGVAAAFAAFMIGGRILDFQVGFAAALMFDPTTRQQAPLFGTVLVMFGAVLFLILDGHHALIRALVESMRLAPPSVHAALVLHPEALLMKAGLMFAYGFALVAPSIIALMIVDVAVAVSARTMPQVNAYFVALPAKVFVGILVLALSLPITARVVTEMFAELVPAPSAASWSDSK